MTPVVSEDAAPTDLQAVETTPGDPEFVRYPDGPYETWIGFVEDFYNKDIRNEMLVKKGLIFEGKLCDYGQGQVMLLFVDPRKLVEWQRRLMPAQSPIATPSGIVLPKN